ncbi:MAG: Zn-ribbon domain-containing protein [Methanophagales archaeon]|nr:Zn-ribbon domain-containing protein [Methanophagales archaeon]
MHKCLKCGKKFEKLTKEMLRGCPECGGNLFLYLKEGEDISAADLVDKIKIEEKVPLEGERIESLRILSPGVYELNLDALLEREGIIMGIKENGSYAIHLPSLFEKKKQKHRWFLK